MIAYLILAHQQPDQLKALVEKLTSPVSVCFIHIDRKESIDVFHAARQAGAVMLTRRRVKVYWGGWSQVKASLALIRAALNDSRPFTHFVLISGADYPLSTPGYLLRFLKASGKEHINCLSMPALQAGKPLSRLTHRYLEGGERRNGVKARLIRLANRLMRKLPARNLERCLGGLKPHGGSQWWALGREAVQRSLEVYDAGGRIVRTFATSAIPDESYFQTVIASSFPAGRIARALTYTDWSTVPAPAMIGHRHVDEFIRSDYRLDGHYGRGPCFFARKMGHDCEDIRRRIDAFVAERAALPLPLD